MKKLLISAAASLAILAAPAQALPLFGDIVAIVDESGSMSGEHAWLGGMMTTLDTGLNTAGLTPNLFGLVGFGANTAHGIPGHQHNVGGGQFGTSAQFATAASGLVLSGSREDGYSGINAANSYTFRDGAARNYILVTDEDRDNTNGALSYTNILSSMTSTNTLLNAVVNAGFSCTGGGSGLVLGITASGVGYRANGTGGFTTDTGCSATSGSGTTIADYVNLAIATGGAAWDLNKLRAGGVTATSFTNAFIDLKVQEITTQGVPEPASLALLGLGLAGLAFSRRKKA